jgi:hypothetical protein
VDGVFVEIPVVLLACMCILGCHGNGTRECEAQADLSQKILSSVSEIDCKFFSFLEKIYMKIFILILLEI